MGSNSLTKYLRAISPSFFRHVAITASGRTAGFILILLATPAIARLYAPSEFGEFAVYSSIVSILGPIATLKLDNAIPVADNVRQALAVCIGALLGAALTSAVLALLILAGGPALAGWVHIHDYRSLWFVPAGVLACATFQALSYWGTRNQQFAFLARTSLYQTLFQISAQLLAGFAKLGSLGLLMGDVLFRCLGIYSLGRDIYKTQSDLRSFQASEIWAAIRRYRGFLYFGLPASLLNGLAFYIPQLAFAVLYGVKEAGWLAFANRAVGAPIRLLSAAFAQVYLAHTSRFAKEEPLKLRGLFWATSAILTLGSVIMGGLLAVLAAPIFTRIFGKKWSEAGYYCTILIAPILLEFVVNSVSQIICVLERQSWQLAGDSVRTALTVCLFAGAQYLRLSPGQTLIGYAWIMAATYVTSFILYAIAVEKFDRQARTNELMIAVPA